jgi:spore coat protein H
MRKRFFVLFIFSSSLFLNCCSNALDFEGSESFKRVDIRISDENLIQINQGGRSKTRIPAEVSINSSPYYWGRINLAGNSSLGALKSNYRFIVSQRSFDEMDFAAFSILNRRGGQSLRNLLGQVILNHFDTEFSLPTPDIYPAKLYINHMDHGLYFLVERINRDFFQRRKIELYTLYKAKGSRGTFGPEMITDPEHGLEHSKGTPNSRPLKRIAEWANSPPQPENPASLDFLGENIDLQSLVTYFASVVFLRDCDSTVRNYLLYQSRTTSGFKFAAWDWDSSYSGCKLSSLFKGNTLFRKMLHYPSLREAFIAKLQVMLEHFTPKKTEDLLTQFVEQIQFAHDTDWYLTRIENDLMIEKENLMRRYKEWMKTLEKLVKTDFEDWPLDEDNG